VGAVSFGPRFLLGVDLGVNMVRLGLRDGGLETSSIGVLRGGLPHNVYTMVAQKAKRLRSCHTKRVRYLPVMRQANTHQSSLAPQLQ
jgi:hypothetical protein